MVKLLFSMRSAIKRKCCGTDDESVLHGPAAQTERRGIAGPVRLGTRLWRVTPARASPAACFFFPGLG